MRLLEQLTRGVVDADPVVLGAGVLAVAVIAVALTVRRLRRRAP